MQQSHPSFSGFARVLELFFVLLFHSSGHSLFLPRSSGISSSSSVGPSLVITPYALVPFFSVCLNPNDFILHPLRKRSLTITKYCSRAFTLPRGKRPVPGSLPLNPPPPMLKKAPLGANHQIGRCSFLPFSFWKPPTTAYLFPRFLRDLYPPIVATLRLSNECKRPFSSPFTFRLG